MARLKLVYPKIPGSSSAPLEQCIAFEKYDGTNLHWVWDPELGWHAFGTRRDRFDLDEEGIEAFACAHVGLGNAAQAFKSTVLRPLNDLVQEHHNAAGEIIAFTEFLGSGSFAGQHRIGDPKRLVMIDLMIDGQFLAPGLFVEQLADLPIAKVVYRGKLTGKFAEDVRTGKYGVAEGVVCKGGRTGAVWMVKIKTYEYMQRLKDLYDDRWVDFWE